MNNLIDTDNDPLVHILDNNVFTSSLTLAKAYNKNHFHILESIRALDIPNEFSQSNFRLSEYKNERGKIYPYYETTFAGFMLLTMGFTGKKAMRTKILFINEFQRMALLLQQQQLDAKDQAMIKHIELLGQKDQEIANLKKRLPRRWTPEESKVAIECYFELGQRIRVIADRLDRTYNSTKCFIRRVRKAMEDA